MQNKIKRKCQLENCIKMAATGGKLCAMHYHRYRKHKDYNYIRPIKTSEERFFEKVDIPDNHHFCWVWKGATTKFGYGCIEVNGIDCMTHRFSYEFHIGKIPENMYVLHKCDRPQCVNPKHLFLGTPKDNVHDMLKKGRGSKHIKLDVQDVINIRKMLDKTDDMKKIACIFKVSLSTISHIKNRRNWKSIDEQTG